MWAFNKKGEFNLPAGKRDFNKKMREKLSTFIDRLKSGDYKFESCDFRDLPKDKWTIDDIDARTKELILQIQKLYPYFEVSGDKIEKYPIYLDAKDIMATAKFYEDDGSVEIEEGSMLNTKFDNATAYPEIEDLRQELIADNVIGETESGLCFLKNYIVYPHFANSTALSATASLILHGSRNGWEYWLLETGEPIKSNKALKKKFN